MPSHAHSWSCLQETGGKLYCIEEKTTEGHASLIKKPKKSYPAKSLLFPNARKFSDIFENHQVVGPGRDLHVEKMWTHQMRSNGDMMQIGPFLDTRPNPPSMIVDPHPRVLEAIKKSLVVINGDKTFYKLNPHGKGKYLVSVHYNLILGSRWIAIIDGKTIPKR